MHISGGLLSSYDGGMWRTNIHAVFPTRVSVHIPTTVDCTATNCGFSVFTRAAKNPSCSTCAGTGRITTWYIGYIMCRVQWADPARIAVFHGVAAGDVGDVVIQTQIGYETLMERVRDTENAYIFVDDQRIKPYAITRNKVEQWSSLDVRCNIIRQ